MAFKEQEREREAEEARQRKIRMDADNAVLHQKDKEAKAASDKYKSERLADQRASMIAEQKKRSTDYVYRIPASDAWVAKGVLAGQHRGYVNLSVPATFTAP